MGNVDDAPGRGPLKVIGIIGIVASAITFFTMSIGILAIQLGIVDISELGEFSMSYFVFDSVAGFLGCCYSLFMYIMAVVHCRRLEKAGLLLILAYMHIGFTVANKLVGYIMTGKIVAEENMLGVVGFFVGFLIYAVIMALYIGGALKNKRAFEALKPAQVA